MLADLFAQAKQRVVSPPCRRRSQAMRLWLGLVMTRRRVTIASAIDRAIGDLRLRDRRRLVPGIYAAIAVSNASRRKHLKMRQVGPL